MQEDNTNYTPPNIPPVYPVENSRVNKPKKAIPTFIGIAIIVIVAIVIFGGVFAYQYFSANNQPIVQVQDQNVEIAGFKTYTNTQYGFEIKYPSDWSIHTTPNGVSVLTKQHEAANIRSLSGSTIDFSVSACDLSDKTCSDYKNQLDGMISSYSNGGRNDLTFIIDGAEGSQLVSGADQYSYYGVIRRDRNIMFVFQSTPEEYTMKYPNIADKQVKAIFDSFKFGTPTDQTAQPLTTDALKNATLSYLNPYSAPPFYNPSGVLKTDTFTLIDGSVSLDGPVIYHIGATVIGDLDGDGVAEGAIGIYQSYGANLIKPIVFIVSNKNGRLTQIDSVVPDTSDWNYETHIKSLSINNGILSVNLLTLAEKDQSLPHVQQRATVEKTIQYKLINRKLVIYQADQTTGWKTYTNTQYGFEIKYPSNLTTLENTVIMASLGQLASFGAISVADKLYVRVWNTSTYSYDQLKMPPPGGINPDTIKQENIVVAGYPATKFSYTTISDVFGGISTQKISVIKDQLVYIIECDGQKCDQIISTFKFTN